MEQNTQDLIMLLQSVSATMWQAAQRQAMLGAIWDALFLILFIISALIAWNRLMAWKQRLQSEDPGYNHWYPTDNMDQGLVLALVWIWTVITILVVVFNSYSIITYLINPNYAALVKLLGLLSH